MAENKLHAHNIKWRFWRAHKTKKEKRFSLAGSTNE